MTVAIQPMMFDAMTEEEISSQDLTAPDYTMPEWEPSSQDEAEVERYLRAFRYYTTELDVITSETSTQATEEINRIKAWQETQCRDARNALAYVTHRLRSFSEAVGRKRRVSPAGVLKWVKGRERVEITSDAVDFCEKHADSDFVAWRATPAKKIIHDHVKAGGEIPDGADIVRSDDTFKVEVPH